jgi:hypothetical protein
MATVGLLAELGQSTVGHYFALIIPLLSGALIAYQTSPCLYIIIYEYTISHQNYCLSLGRANTRLCHRSVGCSLFASLLLASLWNSRVQVYGLCRSRYRVARRH